MDHPLLAEEGKAIRDPVWGYIYVPPPLLALIDTEDFQRLRNISLTYSQIYGAVTMNNTVCLGIFLAVVYLRGLTWDFSAEVTTNVVVILAMALIGRSSTTFPSWTALPAITLYPLSIGLIAYLETSLGWH